MGTESPGLSFRVRIGRPNPRNGRMEQGLKCDTVDSSTGQFHPCSVVMNILSIPLIHPWLHDGLIAVGVGNRDACRTKLSFPVTDVMGRCFFRDLIRE